MTDPVKASMLLLLLLLSRFSHVLIKHIFVGHLHGPDHLSGSRIKVINKSNPAPCPFKITIFLESGHFSSPPPGAAFGQSHLGYYRKNLHTGHHSSVPTISSQRSTEGAL